MSMLSMRRFVRSRPHISLPSKLSQHKPARRLFFGTCCIALFLLFPKLLPSKCQTARPAPSTTVTFTPSKKVVNYANSPFQIIVLTHSRRDSLLRLLASLKSADYGNDIADLRIWVDRSAYRGPKLSFTSSLWLRRRKLGMVDKETVNAASQFDWPHGDKSVHVWDRHVGIWGQWLDTYRPSGTDPSEFGVLLEDDLEVSPMYYTWLKRAKASYSHREDIFGYTLQKGTLRANQTGFGRRPLSIHKSERAFLYLLVGSWGYAPEAKKWVQFRKWFHERSCERGYHPYVDGLIPTKWYKKQEKGRSMWTMWHIKYADVFKLYTVYANLGETRTLASNWREPGLHFRKSANKKKASSITGRKDFALLESQDGIGGADIFDFPQDPVMVAWNGTYIDRKGTRTIH